MARRHAVRLLARWRTIHKAFGGASFASPVLIAIVLISGLLLGTHTPYQSYFAGAQYIHFLLGPATVALAIPLARNLAHVSRSLFGVMLALLVGSFTSVVSGVGIVWVLGGSRVIALSIAPKAVTTPIAIAVSTEIEGIPALTASFAIPGGILAAVTGYALLKGLRIHDWRAHGLAAGVAGSGVAAAQVAARSELAAAFAAVGIALNGVLTSLLLPFLIMIWR